MAQARVVQLNKTEPNFGESLGEMLNVELVGSSGLAVALTYKKLPVVS